MDGEPSVSDLVSAARTGGQQAWNGLVERYAPLALCVVRRHRLSESDAEDVVQTLWLRLVEHLDEIREPAALPGWIVTTTRNECLRLLKAGQRTRPYDPLTAAAVLEVPDTDPVDEQVLDDVVSAERRQVLLAAFAELPDHHRQLLLLLVTDPPMSYTEISRRLAIPIGSIGPTRARALRRIRQFPAVSAMIAAPPADVDVRGEREPQPGLPARRHHDGG